MNEESPFPPELEATSRVIFDHCNRDCDEKRKYMLPIWRRAEYYWNDIQDLFFREDIWDWRTFEEEAGETEINAIRDNNKNVNVYRAYGESIIAAATTGNLTFRFYPGNADEPADLDKSVSFSDKADYIQRVNKIKELRREAFKIRWTQGLVASYTFYEKDGKRFGTYKSDIIGETQAQITSKRCSNPDCSYEAPSTRAETPADFVAESQGQLAPELSPEMSMAPPEMPPQMQSPSGGELPPMMPPQAPPPPQLPQLDPYGDELCPECNGPLDVDRSVESTPYVIGQEEKSRGCSVIKLFAPTEFKIPFYCKKPSEVPYIIIEAEVHYATARRLFPKFAKQINPTKSEDPTEAESRNQADIYGISPSNNMVSIQQMWCKPDMYYILDPEALDTLTPDDMLSKYPDGVHKIKVGNILVFCANVDFDKHWTFVESALDTHVYIRPLGNAVVPVQDMENDLVYFTMDTIRHQSGETFFDSRIINAKVYRDQMAKPGNKYPMNNIGNKPVGEYFHDVPGATLSQQVDLFHERLESRGQLVSGAFPSIYGGQFSEGSKTLGVYEQSRASALQRTTIPADGIDDFLSSTIHKAVVLLDENMEEDEIFPVEDGGGFKNVMLSKSAPGAKIARVEIVKSEQFPTTWEQKRAFVMELFDKNLEPINATVFDIENVSLMARIIGIPELKVHGDADRNKQLHVIQKLLKEEPIVPQIPPEMQAIDPASLPPEIQAQAQQMFGPKPSIEPDLDVDNHEVCFAVTVAWGVSREGINAKERNPAGYENVMLNLRAHKMILDQQAQAAAEAEAAATGGEKKAPPQEKNDDADQR